ncbi:MAG TPA: hypothetical protein VFA60_08560 [Terriglobales bacterium]|nr:hypothetical protein [Terriglobales bacterium]
MRKFITLVATLVLALAASAQIDESLYKGMKWRQIGPFRGGRVIAVEGVRGEPNTYYFGAVAGGVWKTIDGGANWRPLFDHEAVSSIGAIAVAPSNHNIIYVGTGEACIRGNITYGDGVYKSTDGGRTWKNIGLRDTRHIGAVIVDPQNPDVALVAALGHAYGPNAERGVFRTTDGGKTWNKVLYKDEKTGAIDVVFDPHNATIAYAALWEVYRTPWSLNSGGPGSGLYKSLDGGATWKRLEGHGLPTTILGRIGVTVSGADANRVYALIEAEKGGIYRSDDAGETWTRVNDDERYRQRAWYFTHIYADPKSADTLYVLNTGLFRSTDAGKTFTLLPAPHGDHHGLWIDPDDPNRLINGNDGGTTISTDGGKTWTRQDNQPTAQFYHVITDNRWPYYVYGSQQDNTTVAIASYDDEGVITSRDWYGVGGGETGYIAPDPRDANIVYANNEYYISRFDKRTEQAKDISVVPLDVSGNGAAALEHRFQWTEPLILSKHNPDVLYTSAEVVFKSSDRGQSWQQISSDLTRNDKSKQQPSGGPITLDITSVEYYDTVFTIAESPHAAGTLWAGTDDGLIWLTRDDGKNWTNVTPKAVPDWSMISIIEASPHDPGGAWAAVDRHKLDDTAPYIFHTTDFGKTWTRLNNGIPTGSYVRSVREDPVRKGLVYAGTETGPFVSFDNGEHWQRLQLNLPTTPIHDLEVHGDDLIAATHGRSFWILDNVTPLRQVSAQMSSDPVVFYRPQPALRLHYPEDVDRRRPVGDNPPPGAMIDYFLKAKPEGEITLDVYDASGKLVRHLSNKEKKEDGEQPPEWPDQEKPAEVLPDAAGMNRFPWDLRWENPVKIPGAFYAGLGPRGPRVLPGQYQLKLTVGGKSYTQPLEVRVDPRVKAPPADLEKQFALSMQVRESIQQLHQAVNQMRNLRSQLDTVRKWAAQSGRARPLDEAAERLEKQMSPVEGTLMQVKMKSSEGNLKFPNMLNEQFDSFSRSLEGDDSAPTAQQVAVHEDLRKRLDEQLAKWKQIAATEVPAINDLMKREGVPALAAGSE